MGQLRSPVHVAPGKKAVLHVQPLTDVVILVAGTVDAINSSDSKRAQSYSNPPPSPDASYWRNSPAFWEGLADLCHDIRGAALFTVHGWSGDNAIINRHIAGSYIAERLCGGSPTAGIRRPAFYSGYLDKPLHFHLIGHSHGGNVINEFTARTASLPEWPSKWKVKSIVYLSTPFFKKIHQVNTAKFDPAAKILSVSNTYDLTQRVIADFSMLPFPDVLGMVLLRAAEVSKAIKQATSFDFLLLGDAYTYLKLHWSWGLNWPTLEFDTAKGHNLYVESRRVVSGLRDLLRIVRDIVDTLAGDHPCYVLPELRGLVPASRKVFSDALAARARAAVDEIAVEVDKAIATFDARLATDVYSAGEFVADWHLDTFVVRLTRLIAVNPQTLRGRLTDLIADALMDQLDFFDDTSNTVDHQLAGTPFSGAVERLDITHDDLFDRTVTERARFAPFISRVESIEQKFEGSHSQSSLMDLFFTLIAQMAGMRGALDTYQKWRTTAQTVLAILRVESKFDDSLTPVSNLLDQMQNYAQILSDRDMGGLATSNASVEGPLIGDVPYFATVSHALSHQKKHERIFEFLKERMAP